MYVRLRMSFLDNPKYIINHSLWLVEEEVDDVVASLGVVEEDEETPVDEPRALLQGLQRRYHVLRKGEIYLFVKRGTAKLLLRDDFTLG